MNAKTKQKNNLISNLKKKKKILVTLQVNQCNSTVFSIHTKTNTDLLKMKALYNLAYDQQKIN